MAFAAMPTPYLVLTPDLVIADANPTYLAATGRSAMNRARSSASSRAVW